jgi:hypothetical protein
MRIFLIVLIFLAGCCHCPTADELAEKIAYKMLEVKLDRIWDGPIIEERRPSIEEVKRMLEGVR